MILFFVLAILIIGLSLLAKLFGGVRNVWNIVTGKGVTNNTSGSNNTYYQTEEQQSATSENQGDRPHSRGVFKDDEGTYVDFEEVKEDKD